MPAWLSGHFLYGLQNFAEIIVYVFKHTDDGQIVRTAGLACAALYAGIGLHRHGLIAGNRPVCKAVTGKIAVDSEAEGDIDADGTGLAVVASAAELIA